MSMLPSTPNLSSTLSARPLSLSFPFTSDTLSSRSSVPSSASSLSSRSFVSSSIGSSSPPSSKASPLSSVSNGSWENDDQQESSHPQMHHCTRFSAHASSGSSAAADLWSTHATARPPDAVPIDQRQHPRRTLRLINIDNKSSDASVRGARGPPALVRQSDRKEVFVDSLVDTTTQMIETIWPLSVLSCTRDSQPDGSDQILIGLRTFVQEVLRRSKTSYYTLQVALYYLILIKAFVPTCDFTMEQLVDSPSCRAMQCGRRMFLTALILASKYLQDRNYSARAWSKISGLKTSEINANEMAFLAAIKWKLHVPEPLFNRWMDIVLKYSPSSSTLPMSPSISAMSWRSIIPRITPDLDDFEFGSVNFAKDSKNLYLTDRSGPSALPTPPPESFSLTFFEPNEQTPTNPCNRKAPELTPSGTLSDRPILPPLQCPGLLPTPTMTPQTGTLCTPAMSAYGPCNIKSSMSAVMSQVQGNSLARSTLDNLNNWKSSCNAAVTTSSRRSSLAPSNSTFSSPESMVSDLSSRRSRSSSISSVASSTCALPQLRLAMQATRRCAQMKLSSLKEGDQSIILSSPPEDSTWDVFNTSPDDVFSTGGDYFSKPHHNPPSTPSTDLDLTATGYKARTHEAVTTLHELALPHRSVYSSPTRSRKRENTSSTDLSTTSTTQGSGDKLHRAMPCPSTRSRKRERPSSTDLSVQSRVRELIAPRCLGDITNGTRPTAKSNTVLPDPQLPASFLVHNQNYLSSSNVKLNHKMKNVAPRKRTCGVSGTKENCNLNHRLFQERLAMPAPGMWDGII